MRTSTSGLALAAVVLAASGTAGAAAATRGAGSCRPVWREVATPPVPGSQGQASGFTAQIDSVTAVSPEDAWFSGEVDNSSVQPWLLRWDGTTVRPARQIPQLPLDGQTGGAGAFDSAADGWVLATNAGATPPGMGVEDDGGLATPSAERWHGGRWTMVPLAVSPDPSTTGTMATGIAAVSPADAWAVGMFYEAKPGVVIGTAPTGALIEHWDGAAWTIVPNPASDQPGGELSAITVVSPTSIWAVGQAENARQTVVPLVEHWDGRSWRVLTVPAGHAPSAFYSVSVSGSQAWAVGDQTQPGTGNVAVPLAEHWGGRSWTVARLPHVGNALLTGIYAASSADVWATVETPQGVPAIFLHGDGGSWAVVPAPGPQEYGLFYYYAGIGGSGPRDVWAVGSVTSNYTLDTTPVIAHLSCG